MPKKRELCLVKSYAVAYNEWLYDQLPTLSALTACTLYNLSMGLCSFDAGELRFATWAGEREIEHESNYTKS